MYRVKIIENFSSAHNLREYEGNCENLHGHNWKVEVFVKGGNLDEIGMLMDFRVLKKELRSVTQKLDHTYLNNHPYFSKVNPTSENMAEYIYREMKRNLGSAVDKVIVWESETSAAEFYEE